LRRLVIYALGQATLCDGVASTRIDAPPDVRSIDWHVVRSDRGELEARGGDVDACLCAAVNAGMMAGIITAIGTALASQDYPNARQIITRLPGRAKGDVAVITDPDGAIEWGTGNGEWRHGRSRLSGMSAASHSAALVRLALELAPWVPPPRVN
jgi:hypothetical protein